MIIWLYLNKCRGFHEILWRSLAMNFPMVLNSQFLMVVFGKWHWPEKEKTFGFIMVGRTLLKVIQSQQDTSCSSVMRRIQPFMLLYLIWMHVRLIIYMLVKNQWMMSKIQIPRMRKVWSMLSSKAEREKWKRWRRWTNQTVTITSICLSCLRKWEYMLLLDTDGFRQKKAREQSVLPELSSPKTLHSWLSWNSISNLAVMWWAFKQNVILWALLLVNTQIQFLLFVQYCPIKFAAKFVKKDSKYVKVQISNEVKESIELQWKPKGGFFLTRGWAKISRVKNLKEGDICIFELIRKQDLLFKLSVFHSMLE